MSTNGIHSQMQTWLNKHGENMSTYSSGLDKIDKQMTEIEKKLQEGLSGQDEVNDVSEKLSNMEIDQLKAELDYLEGQKEIGKSFDFMEGDYDIEDSETFIPAYAEQTGKLAQGDTDAWETDGEDGISLEE